MSAFIPFRYTRARLSQAYVYEKRAASGALFPDLYFPVIHNHKNTTIGSLERLK